MRFSRGGDGRVVHQKSFPHDALDAAIAYRDKNMGRYGAGLTGWAHRRRPPVTSNTGFSGVTDRGLYAKPHNSFYVAWTEGPHGARVAKNRSFLYDEVTKNVTLAKAIKFREEMERLHYDWK